MASRIRDALHRALESSRGDSLAAVRLSKGIARQINASLGQPIAPREEIAARAEARQRLKDLRSGAAADPKARPEAVPVFVYFEKGRNVRELARIEELLSAKKIQWARLDVAGDEATLEFVVRRARCEADDLPVVFVGDRAVGNFPAVVEADAAGELQALVFGAPRSP
jgi:hypothetical protein